MLISQNNAPRVQLKRSLTPKPQDYVQPEVDDLFVDGSPQWGPKYDKYIASTQVPHPLPEDSYYDEAADAAAQAKYYASVENLSQSQRNDALRSLVQDTHKPNPKGYHYVVAKDLYATVDRRADGTVRSIYDDEPVKFLRYPDISLSTLSEEELCSIQGACSSSPEVVGAWLAFQKGNAELNCEHTVPQSYFDKREPMRSDLHHLYSCDFQDNSRRGSTKYGSFQPPGGKGEVARATLYFMLRYPEVNLPYNSRDVDMLKQWAAEDPPSLHEKHRNVEIAKVQGNRNPFIDRPEWAQTFQP